MNTNVLILFLKNINGYTVYGSYKDKKKNCYKQEQKKEVLFDSVINIKINIEKNTKQLRSDLRWTLNTKQVVDGTKSIRWIFAPMKDHRDKKQTHIIYSCYNQLPYYIVKYMSPSQDKTSIHLVNPRFTSSLLTKITFSPDIWYTCTYGIPFSVRPTTCACNSFPCVNISKVALASGLK